MVTKPGGTDTHGDGRVDRVQEYAELTVITSRATEWIEQALGDLESYFPEGKLDEKKLRSLFSDEAWRNPGFQFLRMDFAKMQQAGNGSRAFACEPINAEYLSNDKIRFTFTINLRYAIGLTGELDVLLKKTGDEWKIADLGTLESENNPSDGGVLGPIADCSLRIRYLVHKKDSVIVAICIFMQMVTIFLGFLYSFEGR